MDIRSEASINKSLKIMNWTAIPLMMKANLDNKKAEATPIQIYQKKIVVSNIWFSNYE